MSHSGPEMGTAMTFWTYTQPYSCMRTLLGSGDMDLTLRSREPTSCQDTEEDSYPSRRRILLVTSLPQKTLPSSQKSHNQGKLWPHPLYSTIEHLGPKASEGIH
jgi:hypothetical protein